MADEAATATTTEGRERQYRDTSRGDRPTAEGVVTSTKNAKTLVVYIARQEKHRKYKKYIRQHTKVYAHDEQETAGTGDLVQVAECRPMSKLKRFRLVKVTKKAGS